MYEKVIIEDQLHPDRFFSPQPDQRSAARELYEEVKDYSSSARTAM
jgi:hypothetical protein